MANVANVANELDPGIRCPCLSGEVYGACCQPFHNGVAAAPTAERLMRSRYTAFVSHNSDYLLRTWAADARPDSLEFDSDMRWLRLDIERTERGGMFDTEGVVEFRAFYRAAGERGEQHEVSAFIREDGRWVYQGAVHLR